MHYNCAAQSPPCSPIDTKRTRRQETSKNARALTYMYVHDATRTSRAICAASAQYDNIEVASLHINTPHPLSYNKYYSRQRYMKHGCSSQNKHVAHRSPAFANSNDPAW